MTSLKVDLETLLFGRKQLIVQEIINSYGKKFNNNQDENVLEIQIGTVFDYYLQFITDEYSEKTNGAGREIEKHRIAEEIELEDLVLFLEDSRLIMEKWINRMEIGEMEKLKGIALLNKFYFDLHKSLSVYLDKIKNVEIHQKNVKLDELEKERTEILTKLSNSFAHEIRNPLTSIKGFVQLLEKRLEKPSEEHMYFQYINQEINQLEEQVNQILFLSNCKNHQDFNIKQVSLETLIKNTCKTFEPIFDEHLIKVDIQIDGNYFLSGLEDQLKLALYKLLQNAVDALVNKSDDRRIKVELKKRDGQDIIVLISNNGPPIPSLLISNLFDPFVGTKELGKGIGLAITKQIVEKHEGYITCWSNNIWTTFQLTFRGEQ